MIAYLNGEVVHIDLGSIIIDVNGVGYGLSVSLNDVANLKLKTIAQLYVYEHIRENSYDLYGFLDINLKYLFMKLLDVNGVGPKMAMSILSLGDVDKLKTAIAGGDVKYLSSASGVGKRLAERIVVDLKNKVGLPSSSSATDFILEPASSASDEAMEALMALGYNFADAQKALSGIDVNLSLEDRVKYALSSRK